MVAWIADYPKHFELHGLKLRVMHVVGMCKDGALPPEDQYQTGSYYQRWWEIGKHDISKAVRVEVVNNPGWGLSVADIVCCAKRDLFPTIFIGLEDNVITLLRGFLVRYG